MGQIREHEATQYPLHGIASLAWQADQRACRLSEEASAQHERSMRCSLPGIGEGAVASHVRFTPITDIARLVYEPSRPAQFRTPYVFYSPHASELRFGWVWQSP
jgi:hypothetical protein